MELSDPAHICNSACFAFTADLLALICHELFSLYVDSVVQASVDLLVWARIPLLSLTFFHGWSVLVMSAFAGTRTTFPAGAAAPVLALYPLSLLGIAGLETYLGWH